MAKLDVLYNGSCPICSTEVAAYRKASEARALPIDYRDVTQCDLSALGLTAEQATRRFHVVKEGEMLSGLPAFQALWREMPHLRWLARVTAWPVIRPLATLTYDHIAAPALYALHRRRQARAASS